MPMMAGSSTTSRVAMPLPTITASALPASSRVAIGSTTTPFIERTFGDGRGERYPPVRAS